MQCDRCGCEEHDVVKTYRMRVPGGGYSPSADTRVERCRSCGLVHHVECRAKLVEVFDPVSLKKKLVAPDEYKRDWLPKDLLTRQQISMFTD